MGEGLDGLYHLVRHDDAPVKSLAAMGYAVADGTDLLEILDDTHLGVHQCFQHNLDACRVVGDGQLLVVFLTVVFVSELTHFQSDTLQKTFGHHFGVVCHVNQLVLD